MPRMQTLEEFISQDCSFPRSAYVHHPDFFELYVRVSPYGYINGEKIEKKIVTLARIQAHIPGTGAFTRLIATIKHPIVVESIIQQNDNFLNHLLKIGFVPVNGQHRTVWRDYTPLKRRK